MSKSEKKCQNLTLKSIIYIKNYPNCIIFFIDEYYFRSTLFAIDIIDNINSKSIYFYKIMPSF